MCYCISSFCSSVIYEVFKYEYEMGLIIKIYSGCMFVISKLSSMLSGEVYDPLLSFHS